MGNLQVRAFCACAPESDAWQEINTVLTDGPPTCLGVVFGDGALGDFIHNLILSQHPETTL